MDKYINAEQLKRTIETSMDMQDLYLPSHFFDVIDGISAADVAEVCRCKDCTKERTCIFAQYQGADGYCSYGVRRDG